MKQIVEMFQFISVFTSVKVTYGNNVGQMQVDNAFDVWPSRVNGRMKHKTGHVNAEIGCSVEKKKSTLKHTKKRFTKTHRQS